MLTVKIQGKGEVGLISESETGSMVYEGDAEGRLLVEWALKQGLSEDELLKKFNNYPYSWLERKNLSKALVLEDWIMPESQKKMLEESMARWRKL